MDERGDNSPPANRLKLPIILESDFVSSDVTDEDPPNDSLPQLPVPVASLLTDDHDTLGQASSSAQPSDLSNIPRTSENDSEAGTSEATEGERPLTASARFTQIGRQVEERLYNVKSGTLTDLKEFHKARLRYLREDNIKGVILNDYKNVHSVIDGDYTEKVHWTKEPAESMRGQGGQGSVWLCKDKETKAYFCLKVHDCGVYAPDEIRLWAILQENPHPGFCKLHGIIQIVKNKQPTMLIFMENGGESLHSLLRKEDQPEKEECLRFRLPLLPSLQFYEQLLCAIDHLEKADIVHYDIKVKNILIKPMTKELKIIDFGNSAEESDQSGHTFIDVVNATWVLRHMLTGHMIRYPRHSSRGTSGETQHYLPPSLALPAEVTALMRSGWQTDGEQRKWWAGDLLPRVKKIIQDLESKAQNINPEEKTLLSIEEEGGVEAQPYRALE